MTKAQRARGMKRLLRLADFLEKVPRKRFDFGNWVGKDWKGAQDLSCGTTACAMGWAATMPEFRKRGLHLDGYQGSAGEMIGEVAFSGEFGFNAGAKLFWLSEQEAAHLFLPDEDLEDDDGNRLARGLPEVATPKRVANNIRKFVAQCGKELPEHFGWR